MHLDMARYGEQINAGVIYGGQCQCTLPLSRVLHILMAGAKLVKAQRMQIAN